MADQMLPYDKVQGNLKKCWLIIRGDSCNILALAVQSLLIPSYKTMFYASWGIRHLPHLYHSPCAWSSWKIKKEI